MLGSILTKMDACVHTSCRWKREGRDSIPRQVQLLQRRERRERRAVDGTGDAGLDQRQRHHAVAAAAAAADHAFPAAAVGALVPGIAVAELAADEERLDRPEQGAPLAAVAALAQRRRRRRRQRDEQQCGQKRRPWSSSSVHLQVQTKTEAREQLLGAASCNIVLY